MTNVNCRPLFKISIEVAKPLSIGSLPHGFKRRMVPVTQGSFSGERLKGRVLAGGADTLLVRPDGGIHLDVRLVLETDAGESIYMTYQGRKLIRTAGQGEYFRSAVQFETAAPSLLWLNDIIAIGIGSQEKNGPGYEVFEVL